MGRLLAAQLAAAPGYRRTEADGHSVPVSRLHIQEGGLCCVVFGVSHYRQVLTRYEDGYPFT